MGEMSDMLSRYVEETTKKVVDMPEEVKIRSSVSTKKVIIQIKVSKSDCGKIIGKKGKTIDSLKTICMAIKNTNFPEDSRGILLEVLEDENTDFCYK